MAMPPLDPNNPIKLTMPNFGTTGDSQAFLNALNNIRAGAATPLPAAPSYQQDFQKDVSSGLDLSKLPAFNPQANIAAMNAATANEPATATPGTSTPLWKKALGVLDVPRALVTNGLNDLITGQNGGWANAVSLNPSKHMDTSQLLADAGWTTNKNSPLWDKILHGAASFTGDVLLDPTTYLTFGTAGLAKDVASATAEQAAKELAERGIDAGATLAGTKAKNALDVANAVGEAVTKQSGDITQGQAAAQNVLNAAKSARNAGKNNLVNINVPFTGLNKNVLNADNLVNSGLPGLKTVGKALQKTEQTIGKSGAETVRNLVHSKLGSSSNELIQALLKPYGKTSADNLTVQEFNNLAKNVNQLAEMHAPSAAKAASDTDAANQIFQNEVQRVRGNPNGAAAPLTDEQAQAINAAAGINPGDGATMSDVAVPTAGLGQRVSNLQYQTPEQSLQALFNLAKAKGLPPGREYEALQDLLGAHAGRNGVSLDQLIEDSTKDPLAAQVAKAKNAQRYGITLGERPTSIRPGNFSGATGEKVIRQAVENNPNFELRGGQLAVVPKAGELAVRPAEPSALERDIANLPQFTADAGGKNAIQRLLTDRGIGGVLNPRSFGNVGDFLNSAMNDIRDADAQRYGLRSENHYTMQNIQKLIGKEPLTSDEERAIEYLGENEFPNGQTREQFMAQFTPAQQQRLEAITSAIRSAYEPAADREVAAGTLDAEKRLPNYMYHSLSHDLTPEELQSIQDYMDSNQFAGRSAANKSNIERGKFKTFAQLDNAVSALRHQADQATGAEADRLNNQANTLEKMYDRNPVSALQTRLANSARNVSNGNLFRQLEDKGLVSTRPIAGNKGYVQLKPDEVGKLGLSDKYAGKNVFVQKNVYDGLQKVNKVFTDEGLSKYVDTMRGATSVYKSLLTTWMPSHQYTRWSGNVTAAMMGGATIKDFKDAGALMKRLRNGTTTDADRQTLREVFDNGILGIHMQHDWQNPFAKAGSQKFGKLQDFVNNNRYASTLNKSLNYSDNLARLALFLRGRQAYAGNTKQAAMLVKRYLFNYNEASGADQAIRLAIPFWSWVRNNLPLQISEFLRQPRYYATYNKLQQTLNDGHPEQSWGQDYLRVPGTDYYFNPKLPLQDLTGYGTPGNAADSLLGGLSPFLGDLPQWDLNKQFFDGAAIDPTKTDNEKPGIMPTLDFLINQSGEIGRAGAFLPGASTAGKPQPLWNQIAGQTVGKLQDFNPASIAKENNYLRKQSLELQREQAHKEARAKAAKGGS